MSAPAFTPERAREAARIARFAAAPVREDRARPSIAPLDLDQRSGNDLRPVTFDEMVGQATMKGLLRRIVDAARRANRPLDHMLLIGSAGTGKTTFAMVVAHEAGRRVFMLKAPVAYDVFEELARVCVDGDILIVDEIHLQCSGDRRGVTQAADPEIYYGLMEDHRLQTPTGVVPFPRVSIIGCTTDSGLLPEPFLARFPLQPRLADYSHAEMAVLARANAEALGLGIAQDACMVLAQASRDTPRIVNRYIRNAQSLNFDPVTPDAAREIVQVLNSTTWDGLDLDMQRMLRYLLSCRREDAKGNVKYQAGVGSVATALGKSRDQKSVALFVEPWLIRQGYVAVTHGGRALTDDGIARAQAL